MAAGSSVLHGRLAPTPELAEKHATLHKPYGDGSVVLSGARWCVSLEVRFKHCGLLGESY